MKTRPIVTSTLALALSAFAFGCNAADSGSASAGTVASSTQELSANHLNLSDPADNLKAWIKTRASLNPNEEVVFYWVGAAYSNVPEPFLPVTKTNKTLFKLEGFNVARAVPTADGYQLLTREAMFYTDPVTNEILTCWNNPLNGKAVPVVHVWNDPVNFNFVASTWKPLASSEIGFNVTLNSDVPLAYPSPLPVAQYPDYSASNLYQGFELFNYYTNRIGLDAPGIKNAPAEISWTRVGQWLPWMQMAQATGGLVYSARGQKLAGGYEALPQRVRDIVEAQHPEYAHAPESWPTGVRSETSWTYFKKLVAAGQYSPTCH
jgi:hypothetical protein